jgi:predicted nucleotidyltransferase
VNAATLTVAPRALTPSSSAVSTEIRSARLVVARFDRLRELAARPGLPAAVRRDLEDEADRIVDEADPVRVSVARSVLGVSKPTVYKWISDRVLERVSAGPDRVTLQSVLRVRGRTADHRADSRPRMPSSRTIARRLGLPDSTLAAWAETGFIRAHVTDGQLVIDDEERSYIRDHASLLRSLSDELATCPMVKTAVLFGSVARGDDDGDSDVDLVVEADHDTARHLASRLQDAIGRDVDTVTIDSASGQPWLLASILAEGRPIVLQSDRWKQITARKDEIESAAAREHARIVADGHAAIAAMKAGAR